MTGTQTEEIKYYQLEQDGMLSLGFTSGDTPYRSRPLSEKRYNELIKKARQDAEKVKAARDAEQMEAVEVRKSDATGIVEKIVSGKKLTKREADILVERLS